MKHFKLVKEVVGEIIHSVFKYRMKSLKLVKEVVNGRNHLFVYEGKNYIGEVFADIIEGEVAFQLNPKDNNGVYLLHSNSKLYRGTDILKHLKKKECEYVKHLIPNMELFEGKYVVL